MFLFLLYYNFYLILYFLTAIFRSEMYYFIRMCTANIIFGALHRAKIARVSS